MQFYRALSVHQSVGPSVWGHQVEKWENERLDTFICGLQRLQSFICWSVGPSICRSLESKSGKMSVLEAFYVCVCVEKGVGWGVECRWELATPAHLSAMIFWPRITCCVCLCVGGGLGCGWGLDAPAHLSETILWPNVTGFQLRARNCITRNDHQSIHVSVGWSVKLNTSHIIKHTGKMIKIDRNNAFSGLKFDTEGAKT